MQKMKKFIYYSFFLVALAGVSQSCTNEAPFASNGEGSVSFNTQMHSDVELTTRALDSQSKKELEDNLTIYIESKNGVIRKYLGKDNLPSNILLTEGEYAIEGWTGDSVSASYSQKFYRGYQKFEVKGGMNLEVNFDVNIANVIVSVNPESLKQEFDDFSVNFWHSRGLLEFDRQSTEEGKKGYFMMPNADSDLNYRIELKGELGNEIIKEGIIKNVERAHEYRLNILTQKPENTLGGGNIKIEIEDIPVIDKSLNVYTAPVYHVQVGASTDDFEISTTQIDFSDKNYSDVRLRVVGYGGLGNLALSFPAPFPLEDFSAINGVNIRNYDMSEELKNLHISYGVESVKYVKDDAGETLVQECWITFTREFFENLEDSETEYVINVSATDCMPNPATSSISIRFANNEKAVDNRLVESLETWMTYDSDKPMGILATSAEVELKVNSEEASDYGIEFRKKGSDDAYISVPASHSIKAGEKGIIMLKGLNPDTEYEYRAYCNDYTEQITKSFITESVYSIPNSDMSDWAMSGNMYIPSADGKVTYWDNGNHGSMSVSLVGKNISLYDDNFIPGNRVAKLQSASIAGMLAAGNLFVGKFLNTVGMQGAQLEFGREFNGSHPSALKIKVNYRPGLVNNLREREETAELVKNENDHGQVYVALASSVSSLNTANNIMFDPKGDNILAYGQATWKENVGSNNQLQEVIIPIEYYEKALTTAATHLVIVCSASKYGDYFSGSSSSVLYLDDFELVYDEIKWAEN